MWKNIQINKQNIERESEKAILINMPHKSKYDGYSFWHPSKLVRDGKNSYSVIIGYTNEFTFKLKKYGNGKWNKNEVIDEKEITIEEFEEAFGVMNDNIQEPKENNNSYLIVEEPEKMEKEIKVLEELKNEL